MIREKSGRFSAGTDACEAAPIRILRLSSFASPSSDPCSMNSKPSPSPGRFPSFAAWLARAGVLTTLATAFVLAVYVCPAADDFSLRRQHPYRLLVP